MLALRTSRSVNMSPSARPHSRTSRKFGEIARPGEPPAHLVGEHGLGRPGGADHEEVLRRQEGDGGAVDQLGALEEELLQLVADDAQDFARGRHAANLPERAKTGQARILRHFPAQ